MYTGLYTAVSGSIAQERRLAILNHNLANVSTVGFKANRPLFRLADPTVMVGRVTPSESSVSTTTSLDPWQGRHSLQQELVQTHTDFSQGDLRQTGNPLDVALDGQGFFVVQTPQGVAYTRQGTLSLNADGVLVTQDGFIVQGESGPLQVNDGRLSIDVDGRVQVDGVERGRLKLVNFSQPNNLEKMGNTLFRAKTPDLQEEAPVDLLVRQGAVETSNSQPLHLLSETILATRAFEAYQKVIRAFDETAGRSVNDIARTV